MKPHSSYRLRLQTGFSLAVLAMAIYALTTGCQTVADPKSEQKTTAAAQKPKLTGGELYQINCNRCHPERYATEWTSAEWSTIMLHMRVRANLPADQAKLILKYLQEDAGK